MKKTIIEVIELNDIYFDENEIARDYVVYEYLVKRASDGYPIRQFKLLCQAEDYSKEIEEGNIDID